MNASSVWTDDRIREAFLDDGGQAAYHDPINGEKEQRRIAGDIFDGWLASHDEAVRSSVDWRVLGGLVPGVIHAAWLRDGDRICINTMDGVVHLHTVDEAEGLAHFIFITDAGQVRVTRSLDSEIRVIAATTGADQ
ncbi:hypothetical protein [Microbacterium sp. 22296]|uniref:hypothetical protein n=1 Tax=Microbacterium sp. 22296 TaxID=3453903 RepID=UPI003F82B5DA